MLLLAFALVAQLIHPPLSQMRMQRRQSSPLSCRHSPGSGTTDAIPSMNATGAFERSCSSLMARAKLTQALKISGASRHQPARRTA